jgi:NAD(P)-dependent dehydrogenase (short-subunit alcohol dehydrogenase family)
VRFATESPRYKHVVEIAGKAAVVTGGSAGIGRAIVLRLARDGASVLIADVDERGGQELERKISASGALASFVRADMAEGGDVEAMIRAAETTYGGLDILVNNAGFAIDPPFPAAEPLEWRRLIEVNLVAVMLATQAAIGAMRKRGGGAVVNVSSVAGLGLGPHAAPDYAAAKAAVVRLTAGLGPLAEEKIRVNAVCPDWVDTPAVERSLAAMTQEERRAVVPPELVPAEDIADAVVGLIRDDSLGGRVLTCPAGGEWELLPVG